MTDATPSAAPTPAQPVATVTSPAAPFPPTDPLPVFVPPSVTDPVSNLDFLPVDDAFALEMRAESIEQLVGGDALRRGESERIEAGRSHTNADLVAGRDRVRVHGSLHEHTGHGLAEQAAHLHTTVHGRLDVHAGSEDTVLLAGHMSDLWDGGTAIVAAMTDDTVAGGGIRVTTPLDLWVHGLMGVEERIGTCTADAVLMESSATHYEREYGPGVHAAGLAVYTGSLYQSSRSSFRPLMRVSSGVRNLIAGSGGRDGGEDGSGASAPGASPPPVPAQTGAAQESATGTLAAGRSATEAPATTLDTADGLTGAQRVSLGTLVGSVDARAAEETGEAGTVMRAEDLPELTRSADTGERLGALQETLRIDGTEAGSEVAGGLRASELQGAVSMHPADSGGGPLEIDPPSAVYGKNAPIVRSHPDVPWGQGPEMKLQLLGGADRPPQSTTQASDFLQTDRRLRELQGHYRNVSESNLAYDVGLAINRIKKRVMTRFEDFGGKPIELLALPSELTRAGQAHLALQEMARQADRINNPVRASAIRDALDAIDKHAVETLQVLCTKHGIAEALSTQAIQLPPVTAGPTVTVAASPPPTRNPMQFDWARASRRLRNLAHHLSDTGRDVASGEFYASANRIAAHVMRRFRNSSTHSEHQLLRHRRLDKVEHAYRAIQNMFRRAEASGESMRAYRIRMDLEAINRIISREFRTLTDRYGPLDALSTRIIQTTQATQAMQRPPATAGSLVTVASTTAASPGRLDLPVPAHPTVLEVTPAFPEPLGGLVHATGVPGPSPAFGLPGPSLSDAAGTETGYLGRRWLDPPANVSGTAAAQPAATETIVTPSLGETSSFWLQPFDPVPAPASASFDSGLLHAGETVRPPPVTTAPSGTAPAPGALYHVPPWVVDNFTVERALLANELPPRFDASPLILEARTFEQFGLAGELAAGRLPIQPIDALIEGYRATDEGGSNALFIEYLRSLKESIERALRDEYPERADPRWLEQVRDFLRPRGELAAPSAASATGWAELDVTEFDRLPGTGGGVSHPAPPPPPSAPGRIEVGAGAPPPAADPSGIRRPGMSGEPHPVAFDPWSAPPGPSSQARYTETIPTPVLLIGAPPGWQGAETPGFTRAGWGTVELPFSRREAIVRLFRTGGALLEAEVTLRTGSAGAFGWFSTQWRGVLDDLYRLHDAAQVNPAAAVAMAMADIDWNALETLMRILDVPRPSP